jgi:uncharacterized protein YcbK (DUF882 family)
MTETCTTAIDTAARISRRHFLGLSAAALVTAPALATADRRALSFVHTHSAESLSSVTYFRDGAYVPDALAKLNHVLRDFRTQDTHPIDPALFDILHDLRVMADTEAPYEIISAYRSPHTNELLRGRSKGVATHSLHMEGRAIDVRISGFPTKKLRDLALGMQRGGVGYYASSNFLHVDTGRVRRW